MRHNLRGMTLIEILVAITLLIVIVIGFVSIFSWGIKGTVQKKNAAIASIIAQNRIEKIKSEIYSQVASYTTTPEIATVTVGIDHEAKLRVGFEFVDDPHDGLGVNDNDDNPNDYLKGSITITWTEGVLSRKRTFSHIVVP